jgi:hypothetical protein
MPKPYSTRKLQPKFQAASLRLHFFPANYYSISLAECLLFYGSIELRKNQNTGGEVPPVLEPPDITFAGVSVRVEAIARFKQYRFQIVFAKIETVSNGSNDKFGHGFNLIVFKAQVLIFSTGN